MTQQQTITFEHRSSDDIIVARPIWSIMTEEDCQVWYDQWVSYLAPFGERKDCVMLLEDFHVSPRVGRAWGRHRAEINNTYLRYSFRVNAEMIVSTLTQTSGVLYNAVSGEAQSLEAAIEGILAQRAAAHAST